jgi:hypothetical protein
MTARQWAVWPSILVTLFLLAGAGGLIPWLAMAFQLEDIDAVESPLILAAAGQFEFGPGHLYGPYGGRYPLVLIHAPLYYRLTALAACPLVYAGVKPVTAVIVAGRLLSGLGLIATLAAAFRLARCGGMSARAGCWAALLVAATPVCGGVPFAVRPDFLGIGFQTTGITLVVLALGARPISENRLMIAFGCFAVAVCIKQHFVAAPLVSLIFISAQWVRGRLGEKPIGQCVLLALAIVALDYGAEEWITGGRMSRSVLVAAAHVGAVHPANWPVALNLLLALFWKCVGVILLLGAAGLTMVSARPGAARRGFVVAGTLLIGAVVALTLLQFFQAIPHISFLIVLGLIPLMALVLPICARLERSFTGGFSEKVLWGYAAAEMGLTLVLWRNSTGGWFNYAVEAVVIVCVLTARALDRAIASAPALGSLIPVVLAVVAVPAFALTDVKQIAEKRRIDRADIARILERAGRPTAAEIFFAERPGANRIHGRPDLVFDPWLYPVFESIGLAEHRSSWLESALSSGPVRIVATTSSRPDIEGLTQTLAELGYRLSARIGPWLLWVRAADATGESARSSTRRPDD